MTRRSLQAYMTAKQVLVVGFVMQPPAGGPGLVESQRHPQSLLVEALAHC
jgi:hypothetical protein